MNQRELKKMIQHGMAYGSSDSTIANIIANKTGRLTYKQARQEIESFKQKHPELAQLWTK